MNTVSVDREFLEHCLSVMRGVGELCQPIPRKSEDDPTEYCGGQALAELANCYNRLQETIAYAEQAAFTQPEQPAEAAKEGWEFTRWSGFSPDAVKNAAMEVARLVYYRQREWPRREWGDIGQLETYSIAQLAKVIYPVLQEAWPQAQEAVAIGWLRLHNGQPDWDECCIFTTLEDAERYLDSCDFDPKDRQEYSHAQIYLAPPADAEAVRLLRKVWHCRTGYGTDVCEMLAEDDYDDLCAEVETFLAQHGGRGDVR